MPKFIDYHAKLPSMPPEMMDQMQADIKAGKTDKFGVKGIGFIATKEGAGYCLREAPNADAVCKSHDAKGIPLGEGDVHEMVAHV